MTTMRRHLSWVLAIWVMFQIAGIVAPVALAAAGFTSAEEFCDCPEEIAGATCPMHHGKTPRHQAAAPGECRLQNACAPTDAALLSMFSGAGVMPVETVVSMVMTSQPVIVSTTSIVRYLNVPDAPPPRS